LKTIWCCGTLPCNAYFFQYLQMVFVSHLHFWASGLYDPNNWFIVQKIYIFNHTNNIFLFCLLLIYSLMLCFWRYKVLLYQYTTQFLNYTISFSISIWNIIFYDTMHLCSSTRPSFLCKNFQIYPGFFFEENIFSFFFTFPIHFNVGSYWPRRPEV